ncbi:MAG TPA: heme-binding protein [Methylomirabilota bacterium]|nr:heme-binding protein [Methylomirabilota bacterium]
MHALNLGGRSLAFIPLAFNLLWLPAAQAQPALTVADIETIIAQASTRALTVNSNSVVAVTDREGYVLGVWSVNGTSPATPAFDGLVGDAITKAGTAAFLSSDQHAFSSRTAGFIVQQHFPPGIRNKPPGPLVGVNFSNLPFSDVNRLKDPAGYDSSMTNGINGGPVPTPITGGLDGIPGGLPLYKAGHLVGGVGVSGDGHLPTDITPKIIARPDVDEDIALAGQRGFQPASKIFGSHVTAAGIRLSYTFSRTRLKTVLPFGSVGAAHPSFPITAGPGPIFYPTLSLGETIGELRNAIIDDPSGVPLPDGTPRLTAVEVTNILSTAAARARRTRAGIRLPRGQAAQTFISVVNNPNDPDSPPIILGSYCTSPDTTRFSWDVSVQKARTALFFSSTNRAFSSRTVGFLAQSTYPPGIDHTEPGLFFSLQERFSIITPTSILATNPVNGAVFMTSTNANPNLPNSMTIFPGGFPLYRAGVLIGAIGVSGDGVDQDDLISASGASLFPAPEAIRADHQQYQGARLPYAKFPRNPDL